MLKPGEPNIPPQKFGTFLEKSILNGNKIKYLVCYGLFSSGFGWTLESFFASQERKVNITVKWNTRPQNSFQE